VSRALPPTSGTVPSAVSPSRKVTSPIGSTLARLRFLTAAISVIGRPKDADLGLIVRLIRVLKRPEKGDFGCCGSLGAGLGGGAGFGVVGPVPVGVGVGLGLEGGVGDGVGVGVGVAVGEPVYSR
jgi:hypothetical protein